MKIAVTRPSPLGPLGARPMVVDTSDVAPEEAEELQALVSAARQEGARKATDRPYLGVKIEIDSDDDEGPIRLDQTEGQLTPAAAALVSAVSRLSRR